MITVDSVVSGAGGVRGGGGEEIKGAAVIDLGSIDTQSLLMEDGAHKEISGRRRLVNKLSARDMDSLTALCDTFAPSVDFPNDVVPDDATLRFFKTSAASTGTPEQVGGLTQRVGYHEFVLRLSLVLLSTWIGTLILAGLACVSSEFPYFHKFSDLKLKKRQQILLSWSSSHIPHIRCLFFGLKSLILLSFFTLVDENNQNPSWEAIGYCGPDPYMKARLKAGPKQPMEPNNNGQDETTSCPLHKGLVNMSNPREMVVQTLRWSGFQVSVHRRTPNMAAPNASMTIRCDAVVVGSGSGGGVVAGELAKAGYKVLVLEKGPCITRHDLSLLEGQSMSQMYEGGGVMPTKEVDLFLLAGSTVGGGSSVNWSASIKTPNHVLREWSEAYDLELFDSNMYREAMDAVCEKMGVQSDIQEEGLNNEVLRKGCMELGYPVYNIPRNAPPDHYCGWCNMGCKDGNKKGTTETWLRDAVESNNGLILLNCKTTRVLYSKSRGGGKARARGVVFEYESKGVKEVCVVEAKVTVVACGSLNTPVLLRSSGLKNPNIGKNLHLHPVVMVWGTFPEDSDTDMETGRVEDAYGLPSWKLESWKKSYEGGIMTAMSPVVANFDGSGYDALIQTPSLHPGMFSVLMSWTSSLDMKVRMTKFSRTAHFIAIARDKGSGEITRAHNARTVSCKLDSVDEANLKQAMEKMLRITAAAGAEEIGTQHRDGSRINVKKASYHEFESFVKSASSVALRGTHLVPLSSAHQMSSCRMGTEPETSAVDPRGETWEVEGLFVADTSVFPTALGVNPMVTVMSISYCTAQSVLDALKRKRCSRR